MKSFLLELRDAAKGCSNIDYRALLRGAADNLEIDIEHFSNFPTTDALTVLNGSWAYAARVLSNLPAEGTPAPLAGSPEPTRLDA